VPVAYFAAENSFSSLRALPTTSFNAGPRRSLAKIRPLGPIRKVTGIPRIEYVSPTFWKSFAGAARTLHGTGPPNTCVQLSAFALVYVAGAWAASSHDTPTSKNLGSLPKVAWMSFIAGISPRRGGHAAQKSSKTSLPRCSLSLNWPPSSRGAVKSGARLPDSLVDPDFHVPDIDGLVLRSFRHGHGEHRLTHRGAFGAAGRPVGRQTQGDL
jgi:hypothetical protein